MQAPACEPTINNSAIIAARMVCPLAFSTTDISNGNSGKNNTKYRSDVKDAAIGSGLSSVLHEVFPALAASLLVYVVVGLYSLQAVDLERMVGRDSPLDQ